MLRRVYCYNIKFAGKETILSVCGRNALDNFVNFGTMSAYDATTAPKQLEIEVDLPDNWLDNLQETEHKVKTVLSDELGLTVTTFNYSIIERTL